MFNRDLATVKKEPKSEAPVTNIPAGREAAQHAAAVKPDAAAVSAVANRTASEESTGSRLVVGADIKLKGVEITDCDTLFVEGRVEASLDARLLQIAEQGVFSGAASMDVAEIRGRFEGELTVRKHLIIYSTGRLSGTIRYGSIHIEEGGEICGDVNTLSRDSSPRAQSPQAKVSTYKPVSTPAAELISHA